MRYSTRKLGLVSKYFVTDYRSKSMNLNDISSCSKASNMLLSSNVHAVQRKPSSLNTSIKINYFCGFFFVYYGICIVSKYFFFFSKSSWFNLSGEYVILIWLLVETETDTLQTNSYFARDFSIQGSVWF